MAWEVVFDRQMCILLRKNWVLAKNRAVAVQRGRGLRASADNLLLEDDDAPTLAMSDTKRHSCYHWEDLPLLHANDDILVYFRKRSPLMGGDFTGSLSRRFPSRSRLGFRGRP